MRFVKASYEILNIPEPDDKMGLYKFLERIGRVCYKSEDKITDESCIKFLQNIRNRKHWAMLEHYIFTMTICEEDYYDICNLLEEINEDNSDLAEKIRFIHVTRWDGCPEDDDRKFLVSGSATAFNYLWGCNMFNQGGVHAINRICDWLYAQYPEIMFVPEGVTPVDIKVYGPDLGIRFLSRSELKSLPVGLRKIHDFMSIKSITDRGVTHEDVRHRPASWAQESTRYCNYGGNGCAFIIPVWFSDKARDALLDFGEYPFMVFNDKPLDPFTSSEWCWIQSMQQDENYYNKLIGEGWTPQQARSVLPNSVKTEIIMTANFNEWGHYFNMRVPKSAHPQMRELAVPMLVESAEREPEIFQDQKDRLIDKENV
ncbi:MAG: FAD-dependent thymidylate synthase [Lachnospiraceae bacterium]|nr:FAD-dependent thymidylate synthase [Lachnospiraceae bacterium]MCM1232969.1 FAD-dependent thymidylate synthase [Ruminococcus flavefaciens]